MKEENIIFNVNIHIPESFEILPIASEPLSSSHECELIINSKDDIILKIYFKKEEFFDVKFIHWEDDYNGNITSEIEVLEIISPKTLTHIDFVGHRCKTIKSSVPYDSNYSYFTISLSGIRLIYKSDDKRDSTFYLNDTSFNLIESGYSYNLLFPWSCEKYEWKPTNKYINTVKFHELNFIPEHNFYTLNKNHKELVKIAKEPRLRIQHSNLTENKIKKHVRLICDLYSFYSQQPIDYCVSSIYAEDKYFYEVREVSNEPSNEYPHGLFAWKFHRNPMNLLINIKSHSLFNNLDFVSSIIERYTYAIRSKGETRFMLLFNVLEQLRNQYILDGKIGNIKKVQEKYHFIIDDSTVKTQINGFLEQLLEIIIDSQKESFKSQITNKARNIIYMPMKAQFDSLIKFTNINPEDFKLNFSKVVDLRHEIVHGKSINTQQTNLLEQINRYNCFPTFIGTLMLKYFGIEDLENITKYTENI